MDAIRADFHTEGPSIGFTEANISTRSLRAGGGMDLLVARVDLDTIHLVGRWRSDMMICYLHTMTKSFVLGISARIFEHITYALIPPAHAKN